MDTAMRRASSLVNPPQRLTAGILQPGRFRLPDESPWSRESAAVIISAA